MKTCYRIIALPKEEYALLSDFLYLAIYLPEGAIPPEQSILLKPELQVYIKDFGTKKDDFAFAAKIGEETIGLVWVRIMNDYGHIDDKTPSFAISVRKEYRHQGIGTALMRKMLSFLSEKGYEKASLSVQKENYAVKMYEKTGFSIVKELKDEYLMVCLLNKIEQSEQL